MIKASIAAVLLAQAPVPPASPAACIPRERMNRALSVMAPVTVAHLVDRCTGFVPAESFLRREGRQFAARLDAMTEAERRDGLEALRLSTERNGNVVTTADEAMRVYSGALDRVMPAVTPATCENFSLMFEAMAPLSPQQFAQAFGALFVLFAPRFGGQICQPATPAS